jgi:hypothetical protein
MNLRSPTEHENTELVMSARMTGIHRKDASGDIHVGLDSSTPCWNDVVELSSIRHPRFSFSVAPRRARYLKAGITKRAKRSMDLRTLF